MYVLRQCNDVRLGISFRVKDNWGPTMGLEIGILTLQWWPG